MNSMRMMMFWNRGGDTNDACNLGDDGHGNLTTRKSNFVFGLVLSFVPIYLSGIYGLVRDAGLDEEEYSQDLNNSKESETSAQKSRTSL